MFYRIFRIFLCVLAIGTGTAYAHPDMPEPRRGVISCPSQEDLFSAILASKEVVKWGREALKVLKELKAYREALDSAPPMKDITLVKVSSLERSQEVALASQGDVERSLVMHARSCDAITLAKETLLKIGDSLANVLPVLNSTSVVNASVAQASPVLAPPAPTIIIIKQAPAPVLPIVERRAPLPLSSRSNTIVRSNSTARSNTLLRAMPRYTQQTQDVFNDTVFINILANLQDTVSRGPGSFSCLSTPTYVNSMDSKFGAKLPIFNATTLSHATSNVPFSSLL